MRILNNKMLSFLFYLIILMSLIFLFFDHIALYLISKAYALTISYTDSRRSSFREYEFGNLKVIDKTTGTGLVSQYAKLRPQWQLNRPADLSIDFNLREVRLVREKEEAKDRYDTLTGIVAVPFTSRWVYKDISGRIGTFENGLHITRFSALGDEIKFSLSGTLSTDASTNNTLDMNIVIYFSEKLTKKIPEVLSTVVLNPEPDNWKSLSVNLKGDLKSPSIELSGKLFRLNIKSASNGKL